MSEEFMKFERYFDEKIYRMQNTDEIRKLQLEKLRKRVDEFCKRIPMLKALLDAKGVKSPESITLDEFKEAVPLRIQREAAASQPSEKPSANLVETQAARAGIAPSDFRILASTSGTTGEPSPYFLTELDLNLQAQGMTRMLYFVANGDVEEIRKFVVLEAFALCMAGAGTPGVVTFIMCGVPVIPVGAETKTQKTLEIAEKFGANLFFGTPSLAEHMIDIDSEALKRINFKRLICGAEPGLDVPEIRKKIEDGFGCPATNAMGLIGGLAWCSCDEYWQDGMHYLSDDIQFIDLADPETREPVPWQDGATGLLVLTGLEGSMPPVRVSPGDIVQVRTEACKCGKPGWRMRVIGRSDDLLKVRGVAVYPVQIDGVIASFSPRTTGEFRIVLDNPGPKVEPPLKLKIEYGEGVQEEELEALANEIAQAMHDKLSIRPKIEWLPPNTLERFQYKTKLIEKTYQ